MATLKEILLRKVVFNNVNPYSSILTITDQVLGPADSKSASSSRKYSSITPFNYLSLFCVLGLCIIACAAFFTVSWASFLKDATMVEAHLSSWYPYTYSNHGTYAHATYSYSADGHIGNFTISPSIPPATHIAVLYSLKQHDVRVVKGFTPRTRLQAILIIPGLSLVILGLLLGAIIAWSVTGDASMHHRIKICWIAGIAAAVGICALVWLGAYTVWCLVPYAA